MCILCVFDVYSVCFWCVFCVFDVYSVCFWCIFCVFLMYILCVFDVYSVCFWYIFCVFLMYILCAHYYYVNVIIKQWRHVTLTLLSLIKLYSRIQTSVNFKVSRKFKVVHLDRNSHQDILLPSVSIDSRNSIFNYFYSWICSIKSFVKFVYWEH